MKSLIKLSLCILLAAAAPHAIAQVVDEYVYEPGKIYTIRTGLGITTQIELNSNEKVLDYSTGFSSGWDLTRRDNIFYLKPKNVDVDTNLMIRTNLRSYILELKVVATDWKALEQAKQAGVQYKVTFRYPNDSMNSEEIAPQETTELSTNLRSDRPYNFNYEFASRSKKPWLVPVNVYDDSKFTYIKLPDVSKFPTGNFPAVFARELRTGEEFVVNTTVEGDTIVVHGVYQFLVLRHGKNAVGLRRNNVQ